MCENQVTIHESSFELILIQLRKDISGDNFPFDFTN
jgi:hypothetical protein